MWYVYFMLYLFIKIWTGLPWDQGWGCGWIQRRDRCVEQWSQHWVHRGSSQSWCSSCGWNPGSGRCWRHRWLGPRYSGSTAVTRSAGPRMLDDRRRRTESCRCRSAAERIRTGWQPCRRRLCPPAPTRWTCLELNDASASPRTLHSDSADRSLSLHHRRVARQTASDRRRRRRGQWTERVQRSECWTAKTTTPPTTPTNWEARTGANDGGTRNVWSAVDHSHAHRPVMFLYALFNSHVTILTDFRPAHGTWDRLV